MPNDLERVTRVITSVSLVACALLLAPGFAGFAASLPFAAVALGLAILAFVYRDRLIELSDAEWLQAHLRVVWIGPLVAAFVFAVFRGATPEELQTLGAVVGLIGMFNYLLRPFYFFVGGILSRVSRAL